jgi:hypothetical protein
VEYISRAPQNSLFSLGPKWTETGKHSAAPPSPFFCLFSLHWSCSFFSFFFSCDVFFFLYFVILFCCSTEASGSCLI